MKTSQRPTPRRAFALLSVAFVVTACGAGTVTPDGGTGSGTGTGSGSGSSSGGNGSTASDGGTTTINGNEPAGPSPGDCYPVSGQTGNEKHVGAYCQKGGGQCSKYGAGLSLQCSSDLSAQGGNFCLIVGCTQDSDCGTDSCCSGPSGSLVRACIPIGCFEAGVCNIVAPTGSD